MSSDFNENTRVQVPAVSVMEEHDDEINYEIKTWENVKISKMIFGSVLHDSLYKRYCEIVKNVFIFSTDYNSIKNHQSSCFFSSKHIINFDFLLNYFVKNEEI